MTISSLNKLPIINKSTGSAFDGARKASALGKATILLIKEIIEAITPVITEASATGYQVDN